MCPAMQSSMERDAFADALYHAARARASGHGLRLGDGADSSMRYLAANAADRISRESAGGLSDTTLRDATLVFERLVDEMVEAASTIPDYRSRNPGVIGERTLSAALARLCPLFPIC